MAEKSLRDLIERQIHEQRDTTDAVDALNKELTNHFKIIKRDKLPSEEKRRERGLMGRMLRGGSKNSSGGDKDGSGIFGPLLATLGSSFGFILKPLMFLGKLLRVGGPISIVVGSLYAVFRDIGENENFKKTIESIKKTWVKVTEIFSQIKTLILDLKADPEMGEAFTMIKVWFSDLKTSIQDFVLNSLFAVSNSISGVLDGIEKLIDGDWKAGLSTIGLALLGGINPNTGLLGLLNGAFTFVAELFGMDFGEGGSFLKSVETYINDLTKSLELYWNLTTLWIKTKWTNLTSAIEGFFTDIVDFFTDESKPGSIPYVYNKTIQTISQKVGNLGDALENFVVDSWHWITSWLPDPSKIAANVKATVLSLIPDWLKNTVEFKSITQSKFTPTEAMNAEAALMRLPVVGIGADGKPSPLLTETNMYGMNAQGFVAARQSRDAISKANELRNLDAEINRKRNNYYTIGQIGDNISQSSSSGSGPMKFGANASLQSENINYFNKDAVVEGKVYKPGNRAGI